jgi:hypothetical protein
LPWLEKMAEPAAKAPAPAKAAKPGEPPEPRPEESAELIAQRDRLLEKFTVMQADLGGAFYEMAIRDHVRMDVLTRKAAELQRVDAELLAVERVLELQREDAAGLCPSCGAPFAPGVRFCAQCGNPLVPADELNTTAAPRSPQAPPPQAPDSPPAAPPIAEAKPPQVPR